MKKVTKKFILIIFALIIFAPVCAAQAATTQSWQQIFPECIQQQMNATNGSDFSSDCDDVGVFIQLAINIGAYLFTFIGALALLVFVYGGFKMIISAGAADKIKEGRDAMVAAAIGVVIAFSGVAIVRFLGESLHLSANYQLTQSGDKDVCCKTIDGAKFKYKFIKMSTCANGLEILDTVTTQADCDKQNN